MKRQWMIAVSLFLIPVIAAVMATPAAAAVTGSWNVVPNPSQTELTGVAATQSNDGWAVDTSTIEQLERLVVVGFAIPL